MGNSIAQRWRHGGQLLLSAAYALLVIGSAASAANPVCRDDAVFLRGDWGQARFSVEIADDPDEMARGLMHRDRLPLSAGMLFVYPAPRTASFWMRNTLIPLDMLFIDPAGIVKHIHRNAVPLDETSISGGDNVLAVLEINGGLADRLGITEGAQIRHSAFSGNAPAWPC